MIDASWYQRPPGIPEQVSAGGVVARPGKDNVYIALTRERGLSHYILPKGRVEAGEDIEIAARREIEEEAGLANLTRVDFLGIRERLDLHKKVWKQTHYFLFTTRQLSGIPTDSEHDYGLEWFSIDHLPSFFWPEQKELIETNRNKIIKLISSFYVN